MDVEEAVVAKILAAAAKVMVMVVKAMTTDKVIVAAVKAMPRKSR